jgi:hypothetical protein
MSQNKPKVQETQAQRHLSLSRRRFLRGVGAGVALPLFPSLPGVARAALGADEERAPVRMGFFLIPNGVVQDAWWPLSSDERNIQLNRTMTPLEEYKEHLQIIAGLDHENATPGQDGGGDHARAGATYLTGMRAKKTSGRDISCGISVDQVAAQALGHLTRFPSLELSCDAIRNTGSCDTGYACAYQYNLSWASATVPVTPEPNPRLVFERLFGAGAPGERRQAYLRRKETQKSVLDFVMEDAHLLERQLGQNDRRKLDEYLTSIREVETRIVGSEDGANIPDPEMATPAGIPQEIGEHQSLMYDIMALAFQSDQTRIASLLLAYDGSNIPYPQLGIKEGHHWLTHNQRDADYQEKVRQIEFYWMQKFAGFVKKLAETEDVDGRPMLENVMLLYGSAISDGNRHLHDNCPALLVGHGGGKLNPGRYTYPERNVPMSNLFISMLDRFGVQVDSFGDSTGRYDNI